jgi:hypothetical protein
MSQVSPVENQGKRSISFICPDRFVRFQLSDIAMRKLCPARR